MTRLRWDRQPAQYTGVEKHATPDSARGPMPLSSKPKPCRGCGELIVLWRYQGRWAPYEIGDEAPRHRCKVDRLHQRLERRGLA